MSGLLPPSVVWGGGLDLFALPEGWKVLCGFSLTLPSGWMSSGPSLMVLGVQDTGIKEIGEGSMCFEHFYEFWGTWKVEKPGEDTLQFLKDSVYWRNGIKVLEVKPD